MSISSLRRKRGRAEGREKREGRRSAGELRAHMEDVYERVRPLARATRPPSALGDGKEGSERERGQGWLTPRAAPFEPVGGCW